MIVLLDCGASSPISEQIKKDNTNYIQAELDVKGDECAVYHLTLSGGVELAEK